VLALHIAAAVAARCDETQAAGDDFIFSLRRGESEGSEPSLLELGSTSARLEETDRVLPPMVASDMRQSAALSST